LGIALAHGLTWQALASANGLAENEFLQIGQMLTIPGTAQPSTASGIQPAVFKSTETTVAPTTSTTKHTVAAGETLLSIALQNGLTWQALATANQLSENDLLQVGQVLNIPGSPSSTAATVPAALVDIPVVVPAEPPTSEQFHTVAAGETIVSIAVQYGLNWQQLLTLNSMNENSVLSIGQQIRLR
jgi:LysM repeat protein